MPLYALENIDDALSVTRDFLWPVERATWTKLALVAFFVGGPGSFFYPFWGGSGDGTTGDPGTGGPPTFDPGPEVWLWIGAIFGAVVLLILAFLLVGSIMEFVFVESLRTEAVQIRRYWGQRWRQGVRLFGFRLGLGLLGIAAGLLLLGLPIAAILLGFAPVGIWAILLGLFVLVPIFLVAALVLGVVDSFTTHFVVPIMIAEDTTVLAGWRRLWPTIRAQWKQYLVYVVLAWILNIAGGIAVGILSAVGALVLLVPFGLLALGGFAVFAFVSTLAGWILFALIGLLFAVAILAVLALAQAPVKAYLRYYALLVLGDVEADFDLVPDQRAAVREDDGGAAA